MKLPPIHQECKETQDIPNLALKTFAKEQIIILIRLTLTWLFKIKLMKSLKNKKRPNLKRIFREVTDQVFIHQTFTNQLTSTFTKLMETHLTKKIWKGM